MIIAILVLIVVLLAVFGITLLSYRNKALGYQEEIRAAKSKVRVAKSKYIKVMENSTRTNQAAGSVGGGGLVNGGSGGMGGTFVTSAEMVERLATEYENAQLHLNKLISNWNKFIGRFPSLIYAAILRLKKENYIDEENLDMSTALSDTIDGDRV